MIKRELLKTETERLIIRPYIQQDFEDYFAYIMNPDLQRRLGLHGVTDRSSAEDTFRWLMENRDFYALIRKETGKAVGHICIHPPDEVLRHDPVFSCRTGCALSYAISAGEQRRGLMEEALRCLIKELFSGCTLDYIECAYDPDNIASRSLAEKLGFSIWKKESEDGIEIWCTVLEKNAVL